MTTAYGQDLQIEDLRNHPAEMVLALRRLLTGGAKVTADPKRPGFYEIESGGWCTTSTNRSAREKSCC